MVETIEEWRAGVNAHCARELRLRDLSRSMDAEIDSARERERMRREERTGRRAGRKAYPLGPGWTWR